MWQLHVLVPLVVAFMLPLGVASRRTESLVALSAIVLPFAIAVVRGLWLGFGFGSAFVVVFYGVLLLSGGVLGSVTYAYGRTLAQNL